MSEVTEHPTARSLRDALELVGGDRTALEAKVEAQARRISELEAALEGARESRAQRTGTLVLEVAKRNERIADLESALRAVLAVSERHDTPTFNVISDSVRQVLGRDE